MPNVDPDALPTYDGPDAISHLAGDLGGFAGRSISSGCGLSQLGANIETREPGSRSSHRHWHDRTDELVVVLSGTLLLVEDAGETPLAPGDIAAFPAGTPNGHCLRNASAERATFLVLGTRDARDICTYSDHALALQPDGTITRRDGSPRREG